MQRDTWICFLFPYKIIILKNPLYIIKIDLKIIYF